MNPAQRIAELEEALEPFSKIIIESSSRLQEVYIRTSDILAARAALQGDAPKEENPNAREADENRRRLQEDLDGDRRSGRASGCSPPAMPSFRWWFEAGDPGARISGPGLEEDAP